MKPPVVVEPEAISQPSEGHNAVGVGFRWTSSCFTVRHNRSTKMWSEQLVQIVFPASARKNCRHPVSIAHKALPELQAAGGIGIATVSRRRPGNFKHPQWPRGAGWTLSARFQLRSYPCLPCLYLREGRPVCGAALGGGPRPAETSQDPAEVLRKTSLAQKPGIDRQELRRLTAEAARPLRTPLPLQEEGIEVFRNREQP